METKHTEFEEMRQQLDILKNKLDNQTLVNDKLIRQSMLTLNVTIYLLFLL